MARTYNDIYYNDDENSTAEILDDMKKLAESVDQQIGSIKSFNNDTSQFIEQVTPLMNTLSEQVIDMHQLADTMFTELEQVKEENKQLREDLNGLPKGQASGESIDLSDSAEMRCELKISGNSKQETSEVECCGDNINIFDKNNYNFTNVYINANNKSKFYMDASNGNSIYLKVKPNKTYSLNRVGTFTSIATSTDIPTLDGIITNAKVKISKKDSITTGENDNYLLVFFTYGTLSENDRNKLLNQLKIVEGTETGEYSPYGQGCINEVICNKNLFNVGENSYSTMGLNITLDKSRIKINGTPTSNNYIFKKDDINAIYLGKFKKGTYYMTRQQFSGFTKKGNGFALQIRKDVWNGTVVTSYGMETTLQQKKVILDEDVDLYLNMWANKDDIYNNVEFLFSIYSDTDINHVQHQEQSYTIPTQQPIRSVGDTRDTFIKKNNKWYEHHPIVRIESYNGETITSEYISNTGELSTGATVDYISDTPVDIECTEEQSTILFDIEQNAKTYKGVTHIYSTDEISPVIDVTYKKDIETLFANTLVEGV